MREEAGFLSAIRQTPADETARLVYADWLDERDDPAFKPKADFIRLELRLADEADDSPDRDAALVRLRSLAAELVPFWLAVVSHLKIEGCRAPAEHVCPGRWELLLPTSFDDMRRCGRCKRVTRFCATIGSATLGVQHGAGVAVSPAVERRPGDLGSPYGRSVRLTPEMIERLRAASVRGARALLGLLAPPAPPPPVTRADDTEPQVWGGITATPRPRRRSCRRRNRSIEREDWEEPE